MVAREPGPHRGLGKPEREDPARVEGPAPGVRIQIGKISKRKKVGNIGNIGNFIFVGKRGNLWNGINMQIQKIGNIG